MISATQYCDASLLDDREFVLEIVTSWNLQGKGRNGDSPLEYISKRLRDDRDLALLAYEHGGISLYYLEDAARADREVILKAVEYDGEQLSYIPPSFRADPLIAYTALNGHFPYSEYWRAGDWDGNFSHNVFSFVGEELKRLDKSRFRA